MRDLQYRRDRFGNPISVLGYGCMRFAQGVTGVDMKKTERELMEAYRAGVNYFDTAYVYPGSEAALGEIPERNSIRESVRIATKLPHYLLKRSGDAERYFSEEPEYIECERSRGFPRSFTSDMVCRSDALSAVFQSPDRLRDQVFLSSVSGPVCCD